MVIYRVKIKVKESFEKEWFKWMADIHIPDVINTGHFIDYTFMKLLQNGVMEPGIVTYEIQYMCNSMADLQAYKDFDADRLRKEHREKFAHAIVGEPIRSELADLTEMELV